MVVCVCLCVCACVFLYVCIASCMYVGPSLDILTYILMQSYMHICNYTSRNVPCPFREILAVWLAWVRYDLVTARFARPWMWRESSQPPPLPCTYPYLHACVDVYMSVSTCRYTFMCVCISLFGYIHIYSHIVRSPICHIFIYKCIHLSSADQRN